MHDLSRLSLNQKTTDPWNLREAVEGCVRAGIPFIGLWREKVAEQGLQESARIVRDSGLRVSSLCRGGWFAGSSARERQERLDDNRRAIEEAATLGTEVLVLVCGPAADGDLVAARAYVEECIEKLIPDAEQHGIRLGIEPLHPMYAGDRSVIVSLQQANQIASRLNHKQVGVVIDAYHIWWEPDIYAQIAAAGERILGFHVCDWLVPTPDMLNGRGMMGDGVIELRRLRTAVEQAGYTGPIEVEIFNQQLWSMPGDEILQLMCERYLEHV
ncbi:sugar phosphate isomerase/epimerase [Thermosporothrix hazakensis]|jgi:sugar phosphate isomerase/epimerase|uniref:Sugar phosphate isomerase/epimerase n=1 Tax=Thermosporothrix hazakensis TaxID=644383 RepID=A0A326TZV4_THEHA|nr:sugar phosphate isomerase/epimerase family protein [Thermosporothrix hazakensis]PZW22467.1 sugar phosphate isomerase/epimerase [Thermosporothrix hazakensis]GCE45524.1 xylose isomerase [Thermosporothrix hazakensis]